MAINRVQLFRSSVTGNIPSAGSRNSGELWLNFADWQLGMIDVARNAQKLLAVRFFQTTATYATGDAVLQAGNLYVAKVAVSPGAFTPANWNKVTLATDLVAGYLPLTGGTLTGPLTLAADPVNPLDAATKQYIDNLSLPSVYVAKAGDRMTGALRVGSVRSAAANAGTVGAFDLSTDTGVGFNVFLNTAGTNWLTQATGFGAVVSQGLADGSLNFYSSGASVAAGGAMSQNLVAKLSTGGNFQANGLTLPTGTLAITTAADNFGLVSMTFGSHYSSLGIAGGFTVLNDTSGSGIGFAQSGSVAITMASGGGMNILQPGNSGNAGLFVTGAISQYASDFRCKSSTQAAVIGWCYGITQYGQCGNFTGGGAYSFYGSCVAFLATGSWSVSDARVKTLVKELDPALALVAVNALKVHEFKPSTPAAAEMFYGRQDIPDETLYGWSAQEIEKIIPIAVKDIGIPAVDRNMRAAVRNIPVPAEDSEEAETLGAEDITIKAVHDRYMLTTLWAAVQHLSAQNAAMAVEIQALKGTP